MIVGMWKLFIRGEIVGGVVVVLLLALPLLLLGMEVLMRWNCIGEALEHLNLFLRHILGGLGEGTMLVMVDSRMDLMDGWTVHGVDGISALRRLIHVICCFILAVRDFFGFGEYAAFLRHLSSTQHKGPKGLGVPGFAREFCMNIL